VELSVHVKSISVVETGVAINPEGACGVGVGVAVAVAVGVGLTSELLWPLV